jgi:putative redox protein
MANTSPMTIRFPGGKRVDAEYDGHVLRTDQSPEHGGKGSAPEPFTLFLAALGTCAGLYVLGFCQARGITTEDIELVQHHDFDLDGRKLLGVRLEILLPPEFPQKYVSAVRAAAAGCKVKKTLADPPTVDVVVSVKTRAA